MLVYDPAETFPIHVNSYGHSHQMPNDGGQNAFDLTCGGKGNAWPQCTVSGTPGVACRGQITRMVSRAAYALVESDATPAYSSGKVDRVLRRFAYLRSVWVFIQDRVQLHKRGLDVRSVFHCVNRPEVNAPLTVVEGNLLTGGVFRAPEASRVVVVKGVSTARIYVLDAEGGTGEVRLVGGTNSAGQSWKQNIEPSDTYSYVADPADQSFEFYVDGKNYAPGARDETYLRDHRNDSYVDAAGDWRIEHLVRGAPLEVDTAYLIQVAPLGSPDPVVVPRLDNGILSVSVVNGEEHFHLVAPRVGDVRDSLSYDSGR